MSGNVVLFALLYKQLEKGTRAVTLAIHNTFGTIGLLFLTKLGATLFSFVSISAPFTLVALFVVVYLIFVAALLLMGNLKT